MPEAFNTKTAKEKPAAERARQPAPESTQPEPVGSHAHLLKLQRTIGNRAVDRLLGKSGLDHTQAKNHSSHAGSTTLPSASPQSDTETSNQQSPRAWRASNDLWYFNGEHQDSNPNEVTLRAEAPSSGQFVWSVTEGSDRVEIVDSQDGANAVKTDNPQIALRSTSGSQGQDDVKVQLSQISAEGKSTQTYEGALGVRTPGGVNKVGEATSYHASGASASTPEEAVGGEGGDGEVETEDEEMATEEADENLGPLPSAAPGRLRRKGISHSADATWGYSTYITYQVLDDKEKPMKGFDVNEKWSTGIVKDDATTDWRRGPEGAFHSNTDRFSDHIEGESAGHTPAPKAPGKKKLGSHKVEHWGQEWYIGSLTPGSGTKVQTNTFQKFQDHATHTKAKSPP
jgi:hypothetical protein